MYPLKFNIPITQTINLHPKIYDDLLGIKNKNIYIHLRRANLFVIIRRQVNFQIEITCEQADLEPTIARIRLREEWLLRDDLVHTEFRPTKKFYSDIPLDILHRVIGKHGTDRHKILFNMGLSVGKSVHIAYNRMNNEFIVRANTVQEVDKACELIRSKMLQCNCAMLPENLLTIN